MPRSYIKIGNFKAQEKSDKAAGFEGLFILIKTTTSNSLRFKVRIDGKQTLFMIGQYLAHSLARARKARDDVK